MKERIDNKIFPNNFEDKLNKGFIEINKEINFRVDKEKENKWKDENLLKFRNFNKVDINIDALRRQNIPQIEIIAGDVASLSRFLSKEQQRDIQGRLRYLLTSGLAVEMITGISRFHHDIDLVLFDYRNKWWTKYATDNVIAKRYWADMKFDPAYMEETAWTVKFQVNEVESKIETVHPAIILVQKLSNAWDRPPRERDISDVEALIKYWQESLNSDSEWNPVIQKAIEALPKKERARTKKRLSHYNIDRKEWWRNLRKKNN